VGVYTGRDPDTVRGADVLYISNGRLGGKVPSGFLEVAPELVVEILSPDDRWSEVTERLAEYFAIGVLRVWVVDPRQRKLFVYRAASQMETLGPADVLRDEEILPGFSLRLAELFR
jgi:Uma2 family endonuclease